MMNMKKLKLFTLMMALLLLALPLAACKPETNDPEAPERKLTVDLDLTAEWNKVTTENSFVQGCVVVRKAFAEEHPAELAQFLKDYQADGG